MKKETQRRIEKYQEALPGLKEKVAAVAMLLVMSICMMATASYAWITLSRAPELSGVNTTVAANGNLEIALAGSDGSTPGESKVGDSSAAEGNSVTDANITWGNLVNLSDSSYGLSNIVLRPALLSNASNLLLQPLKGAYYGADGRVELYYNEDFQFTNWVEPSNDLDGYFKYNDTPIYGVRAISTVQYEYKNNTYYQYTQLMKVATSLQETVKTDYSSSKLVGNKNYIDALAGLIGYFMTDKLNDSDTDVSGYMEDLYNMMLAFEEIVDDFGDALVALANVQVYNQYGPDKYTTYTYTRDTFFAATTAELKANGVVLECLDDYLSVRTKLNSLMYGTNPDTDDCIKDFYDRVAADRSAEVLLSELLPYVNEMVNINTCQIILQDGTTYTVGGIGMSAAVQLLGKTVDARITKGLLKDFEQLSGCKMCATNVTVKATYIFTVSMTATSIVTSAADPYLFDIDANTTAETAAANKGEYTAVAQDTYGMAIDLWVRTNAANSYLVLEGNVLTKTESVRETGVDMDGNEVELYTTTITTSYTNDDGTTESMSNDVAVYKITASDGTVTWYNANSHVSIYNEDGSVPEGQSITTPIERYKDVTTVIGYEGENRVWDTEDNIFLSTDSTTQGNGSCYVFYAEDPAQQENCLRLLSNLRVAFIDCNTNSNTYGKMVGLAKLDIDNAYEESGKVTIPLVLTDDGSTYLTKTTDGLAVMELEQNVATRITAIVYLEGRSITNSDVLAANDIQGQLNIQFGSSEKLVAMSNEELELSTRSVSAVASSQSGNFPGTNSQILFSYDRDEDLTAYVKLTVEGDQPSSVTAFFMRKVNSTQGSREETFTLTKGEDGFWYGQFTFDSPGEYVLRTVRLDGVDYDLPASDYPQVKIEGFTINEVSVAYSGHVINEQAFTIMTGDQSVSTNLSLRFSTDQTKLPSSVRLQYLKDDGTQVTTTLSYDATSDKWSGTASFTSSGVYTLKYVIMNGEYTELDSRFQKELTIYVGMTVRVTDTGEFRETTYEGESFTVPVYVDIYDGTGEKIPYLSGVKLYYSFAGSNVDGMNPDLKWNSTEDCYTGNLQIHEPGIYTFNCVTVDSSVLKATTTTPPTYTCISPEPPSYYDAEPMAGMNYELSTGSSASKLSVGVRLANAASATVTAVLNDADTGETHYVEGTITTRTTAVINGETVPITTFSFELPTNTDGYQSGNWTIKSLQLIDVFTTDDDGELIKHTEANPLTMDLSGVTDDLSVKVVNVLVTVNGADEDLDGGSFMGTATAENSIEVIVTDQRHEALDSDYISVNDIVMRYMYKPNSSSDYGHYLAENESVADIELTPTGNDGKTYTMEKVTLSYAGKFEAYSLTLNVRETTGSSPDAISFEYTSEERKSDRAGISVLDMPWYTLSTPAPTVTITAISPTGTYNVDKTDTCSSDDTDCDGNVTSDKNTHVDNGATSSFTTTEANVYFKCDRGSTIKGNHNYTQPSVTITLANIGKATQAVLSFGAGTRVYSGKTQTGSYVWTANGPVARNIGYFSESTTGTDTKTSAGTITATTLELTYNGQTYSVTIPTITINNPY